MNEQSQDFINSMCYNIELIYPTLPSDTILFIACQSALETSFGKSMLCRVNKNYFGMRNPLSRPSTSTQRGNKAYEWAVYNSCQSSIIDYFMCITYHHPFASELDNLDHFKVLLRSWYCPEKDYLNKITKIFDQFKSFQNEKKE